MSPPVLNPCPRLENLADPLPTWARSPLTSNTVIHESSRYLRASHQPKSHSYQVYHTSASWFSTTSHMSTKAIDITIFGDQRRVAAALPTKFNYISPLGFVLMREVAEGCNHCIRDSHRRPHFGDDESPHLSVPKTGHWRRWYLLRILPRRSHSPLPR